MSVTVEQLLKLPSLSRAKVVGGRGGLSKVEMCIRDSLYTIPF